MSRFLKKIKSNKALSLSEVLVTVLILTLATTLAASCISLGTRLFVREKRISQAQMLMDALTVSVQDELRYCTGIKAGADSFTYSSRNRAGEKQCELIDEEGRILIKAGSVKYKLVSEELYTGLEAEFTTLSWSASDGTFHIGISIKSEGDTEDGVITTKEFFVEPLNADYNAGPVI